MISFIVPAYNEELELPATLRALREAAAEAGEAYELIVWMTARPMPRPPSLKLPGHRSSLSTGGKLPRPEMPARNTHAATVCSLSMPIHASTQRIFATERPLCGLDIPGAAPALSPTARFRGVSTSSLKIVSALYYANGLGAGAFLFTTRQNFETIGGFDEQYFAGEEVFLSLALKKLGRFKILPEPMVTSGRKLRMHSAFHLWWRTTRVLLGGLQSCRSRDRLDLWYDGKRESRIT